MARAARTLLWMVVIAQAVERGVARGVVRLVTAYDRAVSE